MTYGRPGVYINERLLPAPIPASGNVTAAGAVVGAFISGPTAVTRVTSWGQFTSLYGGYSAAYPATFGIGQFFQNGGTELYVRRILGTGFASATVTIPPATGSTNVGIVTALDPGSDGANLRIQLALVSGNYYNLTVYKEGPVGNANTTTGDYIIEQFNNIVFNDPTSSDYAATVINQLSNFISIVVSSNADAPSTALLPLTGSSLNGSTIGATNYNVLSDFDAIDRALVVFAPEVYSKFVYDGVAKATAVTYTTTVNDYLVAWANSGDGFAVLDTTEGLTAAQALTYAAARTATSRAAVYYPNIYISDPVGRSNTSIRKIGPAGAVVGNYLNTDATYGPFKAPAGISTNIVGAIALEKSFTNTELDSLNSSNSPVNAIRNIPGAGIVIMGARTLLQDGTANRYVNMRRSLIYIERTLKDITRFAIFEDNNHFLWKRVNTTIEVFLNEYRNKGGLRGSTPSDSFYILCDTTNNSENSIANGELHIQVGVALQYPAEFVIIDVVQQTAN
jgi:hypothetical protein